MNISMLTRMLFQVVIVLSMLRLPEALMPRMSKAARCSNSRHVVKRRILESSLHSNNIRHDEAPLGTASAAGKPVTNFLHVLAKFSRPHTVIGR